MSIKIKYNLYHINKDHSFSTENFGADVIDNNEIKIPTTESIDKFLKDSAKPKK